MPKAPLVHDRYTPDTGVVRPSTMAAGASIGAVRIRQISNSGRAEWMRYSSAVRRKLDWGAPAPPERHPASRRVAENRERLDPRQSRRYSRRASALADIAETQAAIDAPDAARKTIAEALAVVPKAGGGKERTSALSAIAKAQAATGDIAAARATGGRVHELDVRDRVLLDIADHAESVGKYWEALSASRAIVDCDNRAHSLASVARAQGKGGDLPGATRSSAEALTATRGIEDEVERVPTLAHICGVHNANGDIAGAARSMAEALSVSEAIDDDESCVYALAFLARNHRKLADPSRVPHMIAQALAVARRIADNRDRASAFCQIAEAQARTGDRTAALRSIAEASEAANRMTCASGSNDILSTIAETQAAAGDNRAALATARRLAVGCERDVLLREICEVQCWENNFREAIATAREIATAWIRSSAFADIARLRTQGDGVSEAAQPIALAIEAAGATENSSRRAQVLSEIARVQLDAIAGGGPA